MPDVVTLFPSSSLTFALLPLLVRLQLLLLLLHCLGGVAAAAAAAALVLHDRGELGPLLQQRDLRALPVEVRDRRQALEAHAAAAAAAGLLVAAAAGGEVAGGDGEGETEALGAVGGRQATEVSVVGLG